MPALIELLQHDVAWLDVSMNQSNSMRRLDAFGNFLHQLDLLFEREFVAQAAESLAVDVLHCDVALALYFAGFINLADMIVVDLGLRASLPHKTFQRVAIVSADKLQRHLASQLRIKRAVNAPHSAFSYIGDELVAIPIDNRKLRSSA